MTSWLYVNGHIGWNLFAWLVYSGLLALVADYLWRRLTMPGWQFAGGLLSTWVAGLIVLVLLL